MKMFDLVIFLQQTPLRFGGAFPVHVKEPALVRGEVSKRVSLKDVGSIPGNDLKLQDQALIA